MAAGISTRNRATMEKSYLFVEVESLCGAKGYVKNDKRGACLQKAATVLPNRTAAA